MKALRGVRIVAVDLLGLGGRPEVETLIAEARDAGNFVPSWISCTGCLAPCRRPTRIPGLRGRRDSHRAGPPQTYRVFLLEHVGRAHPDCRMLIERVLEEGHLVDSLGRRVSFADTVMILTSDALGEWGAELTARGLVEVVSL